MKCPLCAVGDSRIFAGWPDFIVLECSACGFRFVDVDAPGYPRDAQQVYDEAEIGPILPGFPHVQRRVRDVLRLRRAPGRALDIGCGKGEVSLAFQQVGFGCTGIDMKPSIIAHLQANYPQVEWRCAQAAALAVLPERFDVITMYHVLEHIPDPLAALRTVKSLGNPGALIVIEVPNVGGWEASWKGSDWHYYKADHVNYFRTSDLRRLAAELNLEVLGVRGYQHFSHPQGVWWKDLIKGTLARLGFRDVVSVFLRIA